MNASLSIALLIALTGSGVLAQTGSGSEPDPQVQQLYALARTAQANKDIPGAIARYQEILKIAPKLGPAYNNLGTLYFQQHEFAKAAAVLEQGLKVSPSMASASALLGISQFEMGEYEKARPYLEASLRANPNDHNAQMFLARDLAKSDPDSATVYLKKLLTVDPNNQELWYLLAKIHMTLSEQALKQMNRVDPNSVLSHQLSAEVMESMNNFDGAVIELQKAVDLDPKKSGTHYLLGDAYWSLSQWDAAAQQFEAELGLQPGNCSARWKIANIILQKNGDAEEALTGLNRALELCPGLVEAKLDRAKALIGLNRNEEAVRDLQDAELIHPDDASIHFLLAKVYRKAGKTTKAQREMDAFSKLDEAARLAVAERAQQVIKNKENGH